MSEKRDFVLTEKGHFLNLALFPTCESLTDTRTIASNPYDLSLLVIPIPNRFLASEAKREFVYEAELTYELVHPAILCCVVSHYRMIIFRFRALCLIPFHRMKWWPTEASFCRLSLRTSPIGSPSPSGK
jgi:hypothetical protein